MATFELELSENLEPLGDAGGGLGSALLVDNARWFIRVRWIVVAVFAVAGVFFFWLRTPLASIGISLSSVALFVLAAVLAVANLLFRFVSADFSTDTPANQVKKHVWVQILFDLAIVTALVYAVGSTDTFVSFAYLFHIALACIFLPPRQSLLVLLSAVVLYSAVVLLEFAGVIPRLGMYRIAGADPVAGELARHLVQGATWIFVCLVVWYLVATLSGGVRRRDRQLELMNSQLLDVHAEMNRQMLVITHDLKAPFSGIESNIEVLKVRFWAELPDKVRSIIERINNRSGVLRQRIDAILMLGELRSETLETETDLGPVGVGDLLYAVTDNLRDRARERKVTVHCEIEAGEVRSNRNKLLILFENLVANAINYSLEEGTVEIRGRTSGQTVCVEIADHGIGIREDALPHIFEEYFRSKEAARFNRSSTGLGLAIVREIALHLGLRISVESDEGEGTTFSVDIPVAGPED
jgi:signal transduction histidine kinase